MRLNFLAPYRTQMPFKGAAATQQVNIGGRRFSLAYTSYSNAQALSYLRDHRGFGPVIRSAVESKRQVFALQTSFRGPSFLGIIGPAIGTEPVYFDFPESVKAILTQGDWTSIRKSSLLIDLEDAGDPQVYVERFGRFMARDTRAQEMIRQVLHGALIHRYEAGLAVEAERCENLGILSKIEFFSKNLDFDDSGPLVAEKNVDGSFVAVRGLVHCAEAEDLARELKARKPEVVKRAGNILISYEDAGVKVMTEAADQAALEQIESFVSGFLIRVAVSDIHLASGGGEDSFGAEKEAALIKVLDRLIECRGTLVVNGDLLDLWQADFRDIRRTYSRLFYKLKQVRRIIYVAGNHDEQVLESVYREKTEGLIKKADRYCVPGLIMFRPGSSPEGDAFVINPNSRREYELLEAFLGHPSSYVCRGKLLQLARNAYYSPEGDFPRKIMTFAITTGLAEEGVVRKPGFMAFYVDRRFLCAPATRETISALSKKLSEALDPVPDTLRSILPNLVIVDRHYDQYRGLYFEHGHQADEFNSGSKIGPFVAGVGAWVEKAAALFGWRTVEEDAGLLQLLPQWLDPQKRWQQAAYLERAVALSKMLGWYRQQKELPKSATTVIFGHTHKAAALSGETDEFLQAFTGDRFANTGTWSGIKPRYLGLDAWESVRFRPDLFLSLTHPNKDWLLINGGISLHEGPNDADLISSAGS